MKLRIATLNCLNLALPGRRVYAGYEPYTADEYIGKTQWLAQMLDRLAADLVLVQEIFHEQALADAVRQSAAGARYWSAAAPLAGQDNDKPRLGLIWRQGLQPRIGSIADFPPGTAVAVPETGTHAGFSRPLLRADVPLAAFAGGVTLTLFNVHLKSRWPEFADGEDPGDPAAAARAELRALIKRGAEAAALRAIVVAELQRAHAPLVVAGDFNDGPGAATTRIVTGTSCAAAGALALSDALAHAPGPLAGRAHDAAFTTLEGEAPERIDHVLVSDAFVPPSPRAVARVEAVEILGDHLFERGRAGLAGRLARIYADHAAVCVMLGPLANGPAG